VFTGVDATQQDPANIRIRLLTGTIDKETLAEVATQRVIVFDYC